MTQEVDTNSFALLGQRLKAIFEGVFETHDEAEEFHRYLEQQRKAGVSRPLPEVE